MDAGRAASTKVVRIWDTIRSSSATHIGHARWDDNPLSKTRIAELESGMGQSDEMAAFLRIVDRGGFAAAARGAPQTPSALSKLVQRLEERLGVRLLTRTTRRIALTAEG